MGVMRIGILTGGGDCPGLNAVIRAVVVAGSEFHGDTSIGIVDGWYGMVENRTVELNPERCRGILTQGGTILGTSRTNPFATPDGPGRVLATFSALPRRRCSAVMTQELPACSPST